MAIKSQNFTGVVLTGDDARRFEEQIRNAQPNEAARRALERGDELMAQFASKPAIIRVTKS